MPELQRNGRRDPSGDRRPSRTADPAGRRRALRRVLPVAAVTVLALLASALLRGTVADLYLIPSGSMEPLLRQGDRISVDRDAYRAAPVHRGDVVVVDGEGSFAPYDSRPAPLRWGSDALQWLGLAPDTTAYVKRVAGVGGDTVRCCTADGLLEVNGGPVAEDYLAGPPPASRTEFTAEVPAGRVFLLGDNRHASRDSRSLLGAPGGGMIRESKVIGRVDAIVWPPGRRDGIPVGGGR